MKYILIAVLLGLTGCVSSPQNLAEQGNWQEIGYRDGVKGVIARSVVNLQGLGDANSAEYEEGYQRGIAEYCQSNHAYQIGLSGQDYHGVCDGLENGHKFRMEWQRGWSAFNK